MCDLGKIKNKMHFYCPLNHNFIYSFSSWNVCGLSWVVFPLLSDEYRLQCLCFSFSFCVRCSPLYITWVHIWSDKRAASLFFVSDKISSYVLSCTKHLHVLNLAGLTQWFNIFWLKCSHFCIKHHHYCYYYYNNNGWSLWCISTVNKSNLNHDALLC